MGMMLSEIARAAPAQTHKIVDGDTLPGLARRYLGSARTKAGEIFEANRARPAPTTATLADRGRLEAPAAIACPGAVPASPPPGESLENRSVPPAGARRQI